MSWNVVYKRAYNPDGSLFFPEKLTHEFLNDAKRAMGSYKFANQYLNEVVPKEDQSFKEEWFKYHHQLPENTKLSTFIMVDPAISQQDGADYTAIVVVKTDKNNIWYVEEAKRLRPTPTELMEHLFMLNKLYQPQVIGLEEVAFQKVLLYIAAEEMRRRNIIIPLKGVKPPNNKSKEARILALVPRFEWGRISFRKGLTDLELELIEFPRGKHDDLIDALSALETLIHYPVGEKNENRKPSSQNDPNYEKWYIQQLTRRAAGKSNALDQPRDEYDYGI
jgi:predicted phage terminase large subunit-like protein